MTCSALNPERGRRGLGLELSGYASFFPQGGLLLKGVVGAGCFLRGTSHGADGLDRGTDHVRTLSMQREHRLRLLVFCSLLWIRTLLYMKWPLNHTVAALSTLDG